MIKNREPISNAEALGYIEKKKEKGDLIGFIRKFSKIKPKEAKELKEKIKELDIIKLNEEQIIKIVEMMPEDEEDLNKVVSGANLNEDETKKILGTIKEYK